MSLDQDVRTALETRLATATGIPAADFRANEYSHFDPQVADEWVRTKVVWGGEVLRTYPAAGGHVFRDGMYLVEHFSLFDSTTVQSDIVPRAILDKFPPGLTLAAGSETLQILRSRRWPTVRSGDWLKVDVDIAWRVVTINTL